MLAAPVGLKAIGVGFQVDFLVLQRRDSRSTKMLSWYLPLPSMLILTG